MMDKVITAIRVQKRNPERLNIELDGEFAFGLSRITGAWLKTGDQLSEEKIARLLSDEGFEAAYQRAVSLINHRPRTEKEIRKRLTDKGIPDELIDRVLERLRSAKLVQDEQYARMWVENRVEMHPRSRRLIRYELFNKGISDEDIERAVDNLEDDDALAREAAVRYERRLTGCDRLSYVKKLSGHLARRGFTYQTVAPIVKDLWERRESDAGISKPIKDDKK